MESSCRVRNKTMYVLSRRSVYALSLVIFYCYFPRRFATQEVHIKVVLSWAHEQLDTLVHTLFFEFWYIRFKELYLNHHCRCFMFGVLHGRSYHNQLKAWMARSAPVIMEPVTRLRKMISFFLVLLVCQMLWPPKIIDRIYEFFQMNLG